MPDAQRLRFSHYALLTLLSLVLFGYSGLSGRPLTMHEARLPQTSREMLASVGQHGLHTWDWLLPRSGGRPWLERPPLPHWIVIASMKIFHHDDRVWVVRLPSAIMGCFTVLLAAWLANRLFGRTIGLLSGLLLATAFEFYSYACLAEDDIYLAALVMAVMALFIVAYFRPASETSPIQFLRWRPWPVVGFFLLLGLTNLTKGPLLGTMMVAATVGLFLLVESSLQRSLQPLRRFFWLWGILLWLLLTLLWPMLAHHVYPDVVDNWKVDYLGRMSGDYTVINQKWYYYAPALAGGLMPWTPLALIGLLATVGRLGSSRPGAAATAPISANDLRIDNAGAYSEIDSAAAWRLVWCWAFLPLLVLSIPHGKHHHYMVPLMAPWAMLAAAGAVEIGRYILKPRGPWWLREPAFGLLVIGLPAAVALAWFHQQLPCPPTVTIGLILFTLVNLAVFFSSLQQGNNRMLVFSIIATLVVSYCWGQSFVAAATDQTIHDTAFIQRVRDEVPGAPLYINAQLGNLDFFRLQFYSSPRARLFHNLTYLRDQAITDPIVFVVTRARDQAKLAQLGQVSVIDQSERSHEIKSSGGRFTLFRLIFDPALQRYPVPGSMTCRQAMERAPGPWCGPELK